MVTVPDSARQILDMHEVFSNFRKEVWLTDILWSWQWWLLLALLFLPWIVWWRFVDKKRLTEMCLFGMFVLATASWMDELGTDLILWYYPFKIIPWYPQLVPINYSVLPITYMLIYQYTPKWSTYLIAMTAMAALYSWVAEPALAFMGIYQVVTWKFSYSFPLYVLIAVSHRWLLERIMSNKQDIE
ncbi:hypothetical protein HA075_22140 [bacterium BFN5]|nr:hypothetical protein HA075_22140 [bacterium BFN5]